MKIKKIRIENFRSIKELDVELSDTTVFIGPNNSGKTAILDALRLALTRKWGQRGTGFTEYDIHLENDKEDPKASPGIAIEILVEEEQAGDWPDAIQQDLDDLVYLDPATGRSSITLRVTWAWNLGSAQFEPAWAFLNAARQVLVGGAARRINLERFWQYIPVFYLDALRDADDEFSTRSQFWGRLLKAMEIPPKLETRVQKILDLLNRKLLDADPRLAQIANTLSGATRVAARDRDGEVDLRLVPLKSWDLLSKAEIILRNEPDWPWLPLNRHGQGIQSLSVMFLFQAFVEHLLSELYEDESVPVLALEEPETHLHPQAARTLWAHVSKLPGQKVITTHSPYFVQHVPFRDLRLVRLADKGTEVKFLPASFSANIPHVPQLDAVIAAAGGLLEYDMAAGTLTVNGKLTEHYFREVLTCFGAHVDRVAISAQLKELRNRSILYMSDEDLRKLETYAMRIRGEIFFARRWLIVEGQAEYLICHPLGRQLGYDLDEHGVAVIDAKNNGNPATFAAMARALGIPWIAVFDGDPAGQSYVQTIIDSDFEPAFVNARCSTHSDGTLEEQLLADGLEAELRSVLQSIGHADAMAITLDALRIRLDKNKTLYAAELGSRIAKSLPLANRMPACLRDAVGMLKGLK